MLHEKNGNSGFVQVTRKNTKIYGQVMDRFVFHNRVFIIILSCRGEYKAIALDCTNVVIRIFLGGGAQSLDRVHINEFLVNEIKAANLSQIATKFLPCRHSFTQVWDSTNIFLPDTNCIKNEIPVLRNNFAIEKKPIFIPEILFWQCSNKLESPRAIHEETFAPRARKANQHVSHSIRLFAHNPAFMLTPNIIELREAERLGAWARNVSVVHIKLHITVGAVPLHHLT
mmetsp:Transcript_6345/g.12890  ORF Transcript_6345/g.12890 Transcript_6345/m.12890 type:complete len:228 (+) Transcript_6345:1476-2159(+)